MSILDAASVGVLKVVALIDGSAALHADLSTVRPEEYLLHAPALDWTFGGTFHEGMLEEHAEEPE